MMTACDDFTDTTPKGKVIPETTEDFALMLNDPAHSSIAYPLMNYSCDDVVSNDESENSATGKAYYWMEDFYKANENDDNWNEAYNHVYTMNVVINNLPSSTEGTQAEKDAAMAEAKLWRAFYYWHLQSLYAPAYNAATAATDLSVPLVQETDLEAKHSRATVETITNAILADLDGVEAYLPEQSANDYRPDKYAAHALKARIFLYMGRYDEAYTEAAEALKGGNTLNDMRTWSFKNEAKPYSGVTNRPSNYRVSPETIWYQGVGSSYFMRSLSISDDLKALYQGSDLRYKFWFTDLDSSGDVQEDGRTHFINDPDYSFTVPEMMLIEAEALARNNDSKALNVLNTLRQMRFSDADYTPLTTADGATLLDIVLDERRRELPLTGLRWLDMKRLSAEGLYTKTLTRELNGTVHSLEPNSKLYVFPIPAQVLELNSNIVPNDRKQ